MAKPKTRRGGMRRLLVRLVVFVLLALLLGVFVFGVYPVSEQSMWPALRGGEDWIGVDKTAAWGGAPGRFKMSVFRHKADGKEQLLVKRVLGLGGEVIDFRGGDVWIGATEEDLARVVRPPELVEAQQIRVPPGDGPREFDTKGGRLEQRDGVLTLTPESSSGTRTAVARLIGGAGIEPYCIKDDHLNNDGRFVRGRFAVPDVRVTLGALTSDGAAFSIVHELKGDLRRVDCDPSGITISAKVDQEESERAKFPGRTCEKGIRVETLDGIFRVSLPEGQGWRELYSENRKTEQAEGFSGLRFEASGGPVRIASLEVTRDVHYVWGADSPHTPQPIPTACLFVAGDNPEISTDSRDARFGFVPRNKLVGLVRVRVLPFRRIGIPR